MGSRVKYRIRGQQRRELKELSPGEFARKYGLELRKVHYLRHRHGFSGKRKWIKKFADTGSKEHCDLRYLKAREVAEKYKLSIHSVYWIRRKLDMKRYRIRSIDRLRVTPRMLRDLEELPLEAFHSKYSISIVNIYKLKHKYHLLQVSFLKTLTSREKSQLKRMTLEEGALKFQVCTRTIVRTRHKLGVYGHAPVKKRQTRPLG